jgi:magnesium transporter
MITVYFPANERLESGGDEALSPSALWIDMLDPSHDDEAKVEALLGIDVPTREEMQEIEATSRLYREDGVYYLTAPLLINADGPRPVSTAISFILTGHCLVTVRYDTPLPFIAFPQRAARQKGLCPSADAVLVGLLETIIDRLADVLERIGFELENISHEIFDSPHPNRARRYGPQGGNLQAILRKVGRNGDLASKTRDSLLGINRLVLFLNQAAEDWNEAETRNRVKSVTRDIGSLTEHAAFVSNKVNFLLDATLGMINIEQNNIIKIFSVMAVVFMPPTLVASLYGMNFKHMPELEWDFGYPMALFLMLLAAFLPLLYFRRRRWL